MSRQDALRAFIEKNDNINFNSSNIPKVLQNLELADKNNCLKEFFLNKKPYLSHFVYFVFNDNTKAARGTDQCAIVFALNFYGAKTPGFAERLNKLLKELAVGPVKQLMAVGVLMRAQMELQQLGISLINFVDAELLKAVNANIKKTRPRMIVLSLILVIGGSMGMPGLAMAGLAPLSIAAMVAFVYGLLQSVRWFAFKKLPDELIASATQPIGECIY